jgi:hypothetical protein
VVEVWDRLSSTGEPPSTPTHPPPPHTRACARARTHTHTHTYTRTHTHTHTSGGEDEFVGLVKVPLHGAYLALSTAAVRSAALHSEAPTVVAETYLPIFNPLLNAASGEARVFAAVGTHRQVS